MAKKIFISFIKSSTYSGQSASSEVLIRLLETKEIKSNIIFLYPFVRGKSSVILALLTFLKNQFKTLFSVSALFIAREPILIINLGQSLASILRVGIWYLPFKLIRPKAHVIISLNGSLFMTWPKESKLSKLFLRFLHTAKYVTILGDKQFEALEKMGLEKKKIQIVRNTFDLNQKLINDSNKKDNESTNLLHLSLLIESKGFPEYLESLIIVSKVRPDLKINAILCGPTSFTSYCVRFININTKSAWIDSKIKEINNSNNINIHWIKGASGIAKQKLFSTADVFVFPTQFPVEAQPLVLIEAMASSCAIITSDIGEIPSTVDEKCAVILNEINSELVAAEIIKLCDNKTIIVEMGEQGIERVNEKFSESVYIRKWLKLINNELLHL
jgi:hypothetical protein